MTNPETYDKLSKSSGNGHEKNMGVFPSGQWGQTVNLLLFSFGGSNPPAPTKNSSAVMTLEFLFYPEVCKASQGWIRTAAEPTATTTSAASGGSSEELLGPRPAIRKQGAADAGCRNPSACGGNREARQAQLVRPAACPQKTAAARKTPCGGCSHFVESSGKITSRTRQCTRSRTLPAAS